MYKTNIAIIMVLTAVALLLLVIVLLGHNSPNYGQYPVGPVTCTTLTNGTVMCNA